MGNLASIDLTSTRGTATNPTIDVLKGSYYANPTVDNPIASAEDRVGYPEYYGQNICKRTSLRSENLLSEAGPDEKDIEGFEEAFKDLGR
jgi:hypothetical protein